MDKENLTLLTDLYQLTMMQGYLDSGIHQKEVVFDLFYRQNPCENGFAITAGLQQAIEYIKNLHFSELHRHHIEPYSNTQTARTVQSLL